MLRARASPECRSERLWVGSWPRQPRGPLGELRSRTLRLTGAGGLENLPAVRTGRIRSGRRNRLYEASTGCRGPTSIRASGHHLAHPAADLVSSHVAKLVVDYCGVESESGRAPEKLATACGFEIDLEATQRF